MFLRLLFLLTIVPFLEIYFLLKISDSIGFGNTILIVVATGVLGTILLRRQGMSIMMEIQNKAIQNQIPSDAIAKGFFIFIGGVLLLTPGILTDALGLSLVFPPTQFLWKKYFTDQWQRGVKSGSVRFYSSVNSSQNPFKNRSPNPSQTRHAEVENTVIDIQAHSTTIEKKEEDQ